MGRVVLASVILVTALGRGAAQEAERPLLPGPFRAFCVVDNRYDDKVAETGRADDRDREGFQHCSVSEHGLKPFVAVFARSIPDEGDPLFRLLEELEKPADTYQLQRMGLFTIFLTLPDRYADVVDREVYVEQVNSLARMLSPRRMVLSVAEHSVEDAAGQSVPSKKLTDYKIGPTDEVTVIFSHKLREVNRWSFTADEPLTEDDIKAILETVDGELEPLSKGRGR